MKADVSSKIIWFERIWQPTFETVWPLLTRDAWLLEKIAPPTISPQKYEDQMHWTVSLSSEFEDEFDELRPEVQDAVLARAIRLEVEGPSLGRANDDTLTGPRNANKKEPRCKAADGLWRIAFAFDPDRQEISLVGGDKSGRSETLFYKQLIAKAD